MEDPLFDPFRRKDRFGLIGTAPMGWLDSLTVCTFTVLVVPIRAVLAMGLLVGCYVSCCLTQLLPAGLQPVVMARAGRLFCRLCLAVVGVWVSWEDRSTPSNAFPCAIVSNHVSWLDIMIHMAHSFPSFVAAQSVRHIPLVGVISEMMGCIYVQRENKTATYQGVSGKVKERMEWTAKSQSPQKRMLLFPEGTTTNGHYLLKFKRGAFLAGLPVQPVILVYSSRWISPAWETITAKRHVQLILSFPYLHVKFITLPVYLPSTEEQADPDLYAQNVRDFMIAASGEPFLKSDATIAHKRQYQRWLKATLVDKSA